MDGLALLIIRLNMKYPKFFTAKADGHQKRGGVLILNRQLNATEPLVYHQWYQQC